MKECNCLFKNNPRLETIEREVRLGNKTIHWGAQQLGVSYSDFWNHVQECMTTPEEAQAAENLATVLERLIKKLERKVNEACSLAVEPHNIRAASSIANTLNNVVFNMAKLKRLISESPQIEIKNIQVQLTQLQEFLITQLCETCREKVIHYLETRE